MTHPYATLEFGKSLSHIGDPIYISEWGTTVLARDCGDGYRDAIGTYPIVAFGRDADIEAGLDRLEDLGFVSIVFVIDDVHRPDLAMLRRYFDIVRLFKTHYLYDRSLSTKDFSKHHRYEVRRAFRCLRVEKLTLSDNLDAWRALYDDLLARHDLRGTMHDFPAAHHELLAKLPQAAAIGAFSDNRLVSCHIWICSGFHAMSHLAASTPEGYALGASYAVNDASIDLLGDQRLFNLGGGAGSSAGDTNGLVRFKKGFANLTAPAYICGKVLDEAAYAALSTKAGAAIRDGTYFPAYRAGRIPSVRT